jgi:hypothetical protein
MLRAISYHGEGDYDFDVKCECGATVKWTINLHKDLPVRKITPEADQMFRSKKSWTVTVQGKKVNFRIGVAKDQILANKLKQTHKDKPTEIGLSLRIVDIEGVDRAKLLDWISDLTAGEADVLQEAFDAIEPGVETDIEVQCQECRQEFTVALPFGQFFLRRRSKASEEETA